ncbi:MAG: hypothetical protein ABR977_05720 [Candidatus Dormibacteria bacterium]
MAIMDTLAPTGPSAPPASNRRTWLMLLLAFAILAVSVDAGVEAALGGNKLLLIVPIGGLAGIGLVALGLVNFENFVFFTIALRASLDITKPSSGNSGAAGVSSATSTSGLDPAGALAVVFILMAFFWFMTRHWEGRKSPPASIHRICLIIFCFAGFLSVIDSSDITFSILTATKVAAVVAMLAVLEVMLIDRASIERMIAAIYLSAVVPVGYTLVLIATHHSQFTSGGFARFEGTFAQPNPFAIYLTMLIVMGVAIFPHLRRRNKVLMTALLLGCVIALYSTFTRSAWLACIVAVVVVACLGRRRLLLGGLVVGAIVSLVAVPTIAQRFADLGQGPDHRHRAGDELLRDRPGQGAAQRPAPCLCGDRARGAARLFPPAHQHGGGGPPGDALHEAETAQLRALHRDRIRVLGDGLRGAEPGLQRDHPGGRALVLRGLRGRGLRGHALPRERRLPRPASASRRGAPGALRMRPTSPGRARAQAG